MTNFSTFPMLPSSYTLGFRKIPWLASRDKLRINRWYPFTTQRFSPMCSTFGIIIPLTTILRQSHVKPPPSQIIGQITNYKNPNRSQNWQTKIAKYNKVMESSRKQRTPNSNLVPEHQKIMKNKKSQQNQEPPYNFSKKRNTQLEYNNNWSN